MYTIYIHWLLQANKRFFFNSKNGNLRRNTCGIKGVSSIHRPIAYQFYLLIGRNDQFEH